MIFDNREQFIKELLKGTKFRFRNSVIYYDKTKKNYPFIKEHPTYGTKKAFGSDEWKEAHTEMLQPVIFKYGDWHEIRHLGLL